MTGSRDPLAGSDGLHVTGIFVGSEAHFFCARCPQRILQETDDGHQPDSTRYRTDVTAFGATDSKVDISDDAESAFSFPALVLG